MLEGLKQRVQVNTAGFFRAGCKVFVGARQERAGARNVSPGMMMQGDRRLNESLQESFFHAMGFTPHVFPNFMGIVELAPVEQPNSAVISVAIQGSGGCRLHSRRYSFPELGICGGECRVTLTALTVPPAASFRTGE